MSYITISGVSYAYPGSSVSIFDGLSLSFYDGWTVLAGANGAGKTTLAALIAGMIVPDAGTISRSGEAILCPQVFTGLSDEDPFYIYDGTRETGEMMSRLGITDGMIADPEVLSGGEKKRLQLLAALARRPEILILDEPTNHLDGESRRMIVSALLSFSGCGIIITHDRKSADELSSRTLIFERGTASPARIHDIPLPLSDALDELDRQQGDLREAYDARKEELTRERHLMAAMAERSKAMNARLSKRGLDKNDHSAKSAIDGARLTGKDRSIDDQKRIISSRVEHGMSELAKMERPLRRKEGLSLTAGNGYIPTIRIGPMVIRGGAYGLSIPDLAIPGGAHIAITGNNGTGKTLLMKAIIKSIRDTGREARTIYIPQEYTDEDIGRIRQRIREMGDKEKGEVLSDMYRLGSNPSFLLDPAIVPSPGELKKLDFSLSRNEGRDIIMMDEPTNHLDITSMRVFERMLRKEDDSFTLVLISHDEAFIEATCGSRWTIERHGNEGQLITH